MSLVQQFILYRQTDAFWTRFHKYKNKWLNLCDKFPLIITLYLSVQNVTLCPTTITEQRTTQQGQVYYLHIQTGVSTWHDPRVPRDLNNLCADDLGPLPSGWETRHTATGRVYFVDHNRRTTQFTDPRLTASQDVYQRRV